MLKDLRNSQSQTGASKETIASLNYAIEKISSRSIYEIDQPFLDTLDLHESRVHVSVSKGWIHEFSTIGQEILRDISLRKSLEERKKPQESNETTESLSIRSKAPSFNTLQNIITEQDDLLTNVGSVDFNIHRFIDQIGRKSAMSVLTFNIMRRLFLFPNTQLNEAVLSSFLGQIYKGYRRIVEYHNDIHAADVLQMLYVMMTQGGLLELAQLNELDIVSAVIASICHDFDHDGLNNMYHVNAITDRAIRYSDKAV
jgi:hypothetical protein